MNTQIFIELVLALGLGNVLKELISIYIEKRKIQNRKESDEFGKAIDEISEAYELMNIILVESGAMRVKLLKTTNGGGIPRIGCNIYSSVVHEVFTGLQSEKYRWENQKIDKPYIDLISKIINNDCVELQYSTMETSLLKEIYRVNGVQKSIIFSVAQRPTEFLYLSLNFEDAKKEINKASIELYINQFRGIIKN
jgi:hypothetical protein